VPAKVTGRTRPALAVLVPAIEVDRGAGEGGGTIHRLQEIGVVAVDAAQVLPPES
jgi:hypothetical protein